MESREYGLYSGESRGYGFSSESHDYIRPVSYSSFSSESHDGESHDSYDPSGSEYDQIKSALKTVKQTGYGIASPTLADMKLETPEIIKKKYNWAV